MIPGFVLLGSHLGDPDRKILTGPQLRGLTLKMEQASAGQEERSLDLGDLQSLGYGREEARRILDLLSQEDRMEAYLRAARENGCYALTRGEEDYPLLVRRRLGGDCPACFFCKGDRSLLNTPAVALAGSRNLQEKNREFAREAGRQAALHGVTLVSGNARGADRAAQDACLEAGGRVISVVADSLTDKKPEKNLLYLSQEDFDAPFSNLRALSRNWTIHTMGYLTLVAQCDLGTGGTWSGTARNLRQGWTFVVCFRDGSPASLELRDRGAYLTDISGLQELTSLRDPQQCLWPGEL